ncbi:MAG TPA: type 1 glutamine amidotransferase domain-containing protein [Chitinophagaceae bacterium]|nr:type 1 glutamine amidotransferase domain-containing protein [Chitinophagaceae bacterium]
MKKLVLLSLLLSICPCGAQDTHPNRTKKKILFVCTSIKTVNGKPNGTFLSELSVPFMLFRDAGYDIDIVSPQGGAIPVYFKFDTTAFIRRALESPYYQEKTKQSLVAEKIKIAEYDAVIIPGGYGQFWDIHNDMKISSIISGVYENGGVIGAVGHGASSLADVKLSSGEYLVTGKELTCFPTWLEEEAMTEADHGRLLPFDMEDRLKMRGAHLKPAIRGSRETGRVTDMKNRIVTAATADGGEYIASSIVDLLKTQD